MRSVVLNTLYPPLSGSYWYLTMANKPNLSLGSIIVKIGIVSFVLAAVVATTQSLMLYMGGDTFGASRPATLAATISSWLLTVIGVGLFQAFFLCVRPLHL